MLAEYNLGQISKAIGVTAQTVSRWVNKEGLKATSKNRRLYKIKKEDLKEFIENPPNSRTKGIIALVDREVLEELIGKPKRRRDYYRYRASARSIGWVLP